MKRKLASLVTFCFLASVLAFGYNNCGGSSSSSGTYYGTEIGNPGSGLAPVLSSQAVVAECILISMCSGMTLDSCESGASTAPNMDVALGLPSGNYSNLIDIQKAEAQGQIQVNETTLESCIHSINALSCSDSIVGGSLQSKNGGGGVDYTGILQAEPCALFQ